jgi:hypothetical protein
LSLRDPGRRGANRGYPFVVLAQIVHRPAWFGVCAAIPCVGLVFIWMLMRDLARSFGKSPAFGTLMFFVPMICVPILGFGESRYLGSSVRRR